MSPKFTEMAEIARSYCSLVEHLDEYDSTWLQRVASLLPRLHAAVADLGFPEDISEQSLMPDLDARFELFSRLRRMLGDRDAYWMEFDMSHDIHCMSGSLADDLTDIYCELKHGLKLLDGRPSEPARVLSGWCSSYKVHWGRHLVDAERHLYELDTRGQLGL